MKLFKTATLLFIVSTSSTLAASYYPTSENECSTVDFRDDFTLKMRDQKNVSWCFAHAASDYLQYTYKIPEQISAADIAINYSQSSPSKLIKFFKGIFNKTARSLPAQTGFIKIAVQKIIPQGYCPESALPSEEWTQVDPNGNETKLEMKESILAALDLQKKVKTGLYTSAQKLPWHFKFKNINREQFFDILKTSKNNRLMLNIRSAACKNERKPFGNYWIGSDFQVRGKYVFKNMNYTFDQNMPVTIDFFSDILRNYDNSKNRLSEMHTVLVYGRKFDPGTQQCTYMIKDSYGSQCTKYDPKIKCEDGYVWLAENKLFRSMTSQLIFYK